MSVLYMETYKLTQIALLEVWGDSNNLKPLFEVEIDKVRYYATTTVYGEVMIGPPIPPKAKPIEDKDESTATIFINGNEYKVSKTLGKLYKHNIQRIVGKVDNTLEVTYRYLDGRNGTMFDMMGLSVEDGMIFNVQHTGNA